VGVAAVILGIIGVVVCWIPLIGWVGVLLGLIAAVFGILALKKGYRGLGITGLILGVIAAGWGAWEQYEVLSYLEPVPTVETEKVELEKGMVDAKITEEVDDDLAKALEAAAAQNQ
jgi:hypothetical protein